MLEIIDMRVFFFFLGQKSLSIKTHKQIDDPTSDPNFIAIHPSAVQTE